MTNIAEIKTLFFFVYEPLDISSINKNEGAFGNQG